MWKKIVDKLFCTHKWNSHAKAPKKLYWDGELNIPSGNIEVLICEKCGKIKQINY